MSHINGVIDADPHFEIDIVTRSIRNVSKTKTTLVQYDHNSERFSFTLPRFIEGHDMMECNRVQVHYINIDTKTKVVKADVHDIKDLAICEEKPENVCCTWLIKETATQYAGVLQFSLRFACVSEGGVVDYSWGTVPFLGISVSAGINNAEAIVEQYSDILEQWKAELKEYVDEENAILGGRMASIGRIADNAKQTAEDAQKTAQSKQSPATTLAGYGISDAYTKTEIDKMLSGVGTGDDGKSAYEIAVDKGFEGTEEEWLASLKGETVNTWVGDAPVYHIGKNIFDVSKVIRSGDGNIDAKTGEVVDGSYYVYGKYDLTVGESYTISKKTGNAVWLYFYNADGSYVVVGSVFAMSSPETEKTFEATYPLVVVVSLKEPTAYNIQLELGETATDYEPFYISLNENIKIPIVGDEELATDSKILKGAINEVKKGVDEVIELGANISENTDSIFEIEKVLPRLNEEIIGFEDGFINADGSMGSSDYFLHSNKILLRSGKTYNVKEAFLLDEKGDGYTAFYDLEGNFLGRGTGYTGVTYNRKSNYIGTITVGDTDVYAVLQTLKSKIDNVSISRFVDGKASSDICENLLINKNLMDKKILIFGDSISTGDTSAEIYTGEKYGGYNKWVEALIDDNYIAKHNVRNDSIHATGFVSRVNGEDDLITRLRNTTDTDFDLVIVFAGINDAIRANLLEIGFGMDEQGNKQTDILKYFVPAVDTFFAELVEKFVNSRICVVLPLRTFHSHAGPGVGEMWDGTTHLETDYSDYIAKVAKEYCLPVLDATNQSGFAPFNSAFKNRWTLQVGDVHDGVHPTEEYCKKYLSKYICGFIDGLI